MKRARNQLYFSGTSRGDFAGCGCLLVKDGQVVATMGESLGQMSPLDAELTGALKGLELALDRGMDDLELLTPSILTARLLSGEYKSRLPESVALLSKIRSLGLTWTVGTGRNYATAQLAAQARMDAESARRQDAARRESQESPPEFTLHCDGSSWNGLGGIGCVLMDDTGRPVDKISRRIGPATSNQAEYAALIEGVALAVSRGASCLLIKMDSELVVKQINGEYKVRDESLKTLWEEALDRLRAIPSWSLVWIPRAENTLADRLSCGFCD